MCKKMFKAGFALAILIGIGAAVLGPQRAQSMVRQVTTNVQEMVDNSFDESTQMRNQVTALQEQLPEQIGQVRSDIAEINTQIHELERDKAICEHVVALVDRDLGSLESQIQPASANGSGTVAFASSVSLNGRLLPMSAARTKIMNLQQTRETYLERAFEAGQSLVYLQDQALQFEEALGDLESDRARLDLQIAQIDKEIGAIERNKRMIELLESRKAKLASYKRIDSGSLDSVYAKLKEIRTRQQAELDYLANRGTTVDYEQQAIQELQADRDIIRQAAELYELPSVLHKTNNR
jgi:ribosomal protein L29